LYVGPENGLFDRITARAREVEAWNIVWEPPRLSATFHGRDLFAPVAAMLASGQASPDDLGVPVPVPCRDWPDDLARIVYTDRYGNAMTGIRAASLDVGVTFRVQGRTLARARTFSEVPKGQGFWYENANGLAELAVNQGSAAERFRLRPGEPLEVLGNTFTWIRVR
jgi:S-adenosylmethionine hydrolase